MPYKTATPPLTSTAFVIGWMMVAIGLVSGFAPDFILQPITQEFMDQVPREIMGLYMVGAGFWVAKPGHKHRPLRGVLLAFSHVLWVGVCIWPAFTDTDTRVSVVGAILWTSLAVLAIMDSHAKEYDPDFYLPKQKKSRSTN